MHSYAEFIEMKLPNVRNYAFVRRVIEMKRTSVNYLCAELILCECETLSTLSSLIFLVREELKAV